jgi:tRNA 2-thiouridine synthesizing protein A
VRRELDTSGSLCPLPLLLAKREMRQLNSGDELVVTATDPEASVDFGAWVAIEGHKLTERRYDDHLVFTITKI